VAGRRAVERSVVHDLLEDEDWPLFSNGEMAPGGLRLSMVDFEVERTLMEDCAIGTQRAARATEASFVGGEVWAGSRTLIGVWERFSVPFDSAKGKLGRRQSLWASEAEAGRDWRAIGECQPDVIMQWSDDGWARQGFVITDQGGFVEAAAAVFHRGLRTALFVDPVGEARDVSSLSSVFEPSVREADPDWVWLGHALTAASVGLVCLRMYCDIDERVASASIIGERGLVRALVKESDLGPQSRLSRST
jgi:hypothetical protein